MTGTICGPSVARFGISRSLAVALAIIFLDFAAIGSSTARATGICDPRNNNCGNFVIPHSGYAETNGVITFPGASPPLELRVLDLVGPMQVAETVPLPLPGASAQTDSGIFVATLIDLGPGTILQGKHAVVNITYPIANNNGSGGGTTYDTEILGLILTGTYAGPSGPIPFIFRESPTLASIGQHSLLPLPGPGTFQVNSFFDVFTELSVDNGQTFYPASGPIHLELQHISPEPASMVMAGIGLAGGAIVVRLHRRRWRRAS